MRNLDISSKGATIKAGGALIWYATERMLTIVIVVLGELSRGKGGLRIQSHQGF